MRTTTRQSKRAATLDDFVHFHGMLCAPSTAQRCIRAFAQGTVLFMPADEYPTVTTSSLDVYAIPGHAMTLFMYYALVFVSLTGLSSLLGCTEYLVGRTETSQVMDLTDKDLKVSAESNPQLFVNAKALRYLALSSWSSSSTTTFNTLPLTLERRFEYQFFGLSVMMLHFQQGTALHLVEVWQATNPLLRWIANIVMRSPATTTTTTKGNAQKQA